MTEFFLIFFVFIKFLSMINSQVYSKSCVMSFPHTLQRIQRISFYEVLGNEVQMKPLALQHSFYTWCLSQESGWFGVFLFYVLKNHLTK